MGGREPGLGYQHLFDVLLDPVIVPIHTVTPDVALLRNEVACLCRGAMQSNSPAGCDDLPFDGHNEHRPQRLLSSRKA